MIFYLTPQEFIEHLLKEFLNTLVVDATHECKCLVPGSRPISQINPGPFKSIFLYDDAGDDYSDLLKKFGSDRNIYCLIGGSDALFSQFPIINKYSDPPNIHQIHSPMLGSLAFSAEKSPIVEILKLQKSLADAVWYNSSTCSDWPMGVCKNLFLSSSIACKKSLIQEFGINTVIRLGCGYLTDCDCVAFHDFPIQDNTNQELGNLLDTIADMIHQEIINDKKVLVHCQAGVSRSATFVLAYLMKYHNLSLYDAWNHVYKIRPIIRPNAGFAKELQKFEMSLFNTVEPSIPVFWMSISYHYYISYMDFMFRASTFKQFLVEE